MAGTYISYQEAIEIPADDLLAIIVSGKNPDGTDWAGFRGAGGGTDNTKISKDHTNGPYTINYQTAYKDQIYTNDGNTVKIDLKETGFIPSVIAGSDGYGTFFLDRLYSTVGLQGVFIGTVDVGGKPAHLVSATYEKDGDTQLAGFLIAQVDNTGAFQGNFYAQLTHEGLILGDHELAGGGITIYGDNEGNKALRIDSTSHYDIFINPDNATEAPDLSYLVGSTGVFSINGIEGKALFRLGAGNNSTTLQINETSLATNPILEFDMFDGQGHTQPAFSVEFNGSITGRLNTEATAQNSDIFHSVIRYEGVGAHFIDGFGSQFWFVAENKNNFAYVQAVIGTKATNGALDSADLYFSSVNAGNPNFDQIILRYTGEVVIGATGPLTINETAGGISFGTDIGSNIGLSSDQMFAFWGATPVVQQVLATGALHTVDDVITMLQTLGLVKQS